MLVEKWGLPDAYGYAVAYHHAPDSVQPEKREKYQPIADVVHTANTLCLMLGVGIGADGLQNPMYPQVFERLGIEDGEALLSELVDFVQVAAEELESWESPENE